MCKTIVCLPQGVVGFTVRQERCYSICNISVSRDVPQSITAHDQDIISPVFVLRDIVYLYLNKPGLKMVSEFWTLVYCRARVKRIFNI